MGAITGIPHCWANTNKGVLERLNPFACREVVLCILVNIGLSDLAGRGCS